MRKAVHELHPGDTILIRGQWCRVLQVDLPGKESGEQFRLAAMNMQTQEVFLGMRPQGSEFEVKEEE